MPGSTVSTTIATAVTLGAGAYASPLTITTTGGIAPAASGSTALTVESRPGPGIEPGQHHRRRQRRHRHQPGIGQRDQ